MLWYDYVGVIVVGVVLALFFYFKVYLWWRLDGSGPA